MATSSNITSLIKNFQNSLYNFQRRIYKRKPYTKKDIERGRIRTTNAYYVVLPELPSDTPETNPILRIKDYPQFKQISADNIVRGCAKVVINHDVAMGIHIDSLPERKLLSVESVIDPIEKESVELNTVIQTAVQKWRIKDVPDVNAAVSRIEFKSERAKNDFWEDGILFNTLEKLQADKSLTDYQQRLVEMYLLEGRKRGATVPDLKKGNYYLFKYERLENHKERFRKFRDITHNSFTHTVYSEASLAEMPRYLKATIAKDWRYPSKGPWTVVLEDHIYNAFLQYCSNREERWNVWWAYNNRSSSQHISEHVTNHRTIGKLLWDHQDVAKHMGYENHMEHAMENQMAGSVDNVLNMLESLKVHFKPIATEGLAELQQFAKSSGCNHSLKLWDIPYWARAHREELYGVNPQIVCEYFPYEKVRNNMFNLFENMFGITIEDCSSEVELWHELVKFYKVFDKDSNSHVASFYLDAYHREKKPSYEPVCGREKSDVIGCLPISYMCHNVLESQAGMPSMMTLSQVAKLFEHFGHVLQQILTTSPYSMLAGENALEKDSKKIIPFFCKELVYNPSVMKSISCQFETEEPLSDHLIHSIIQDRNYWFAFEMVQELYKSAFDIELYMDPEKYWYGQMVHVWKEFMPIELEHEDMHPCSFLEIFAGDYAGGYYSFTWSKMIAADLYSAFNEVGFEDKDKLAVIGKRLRNTHLAEGGAVPTRELFRRFMGRDPTQDALKHFTSTQNMSQQPKLKYSA